MCGSETKEVNRKRGQYWFTFYNLWLTLTFLIFPAFWDRWLTYFVNEATGSENCQPMVVAQQVTSRAKLYLKSFLFLAFSFSTRRSDLALVSVGLECDRGIRDRWPIPRWELRRAVRTGVDYLCSPLMLTVNAPKSSPHPTRYSVQIELNTLCVAGKYSVTEPYP